MDTHPTAARCACANTFDRTYPGKKLVHLVEAKEDTHGDGRQNIGRREIDVQLHSGRNLRVAHAQRETSGDVGHANSRRGGRPGHATEFGDPEVRDHADQSDDDQRIRCVVGFARRKRQPERHRQHDVDIAQDGHRDPSDRDQVNDRHHP